MVEDNQDTSVKPLVIDVTTGNIEFIKKFGCNIIGNTGSLNKIILHDTNSSNILLKINFNGSKENIIDIGNIHHLSGEINFIGDKNIFVLNSSNQRIQIIITFYKNENKIVFGKNVSANLLNVLADGGGKVIKIGDECMFSWGIHLRTSDSHAIIDIAQKKQINLPEDITIESYVWIAQDVLVMKGVRIGHGSIIGARSTVTRDVPQFSLAVGTPAKVIQAGVTWSRHSLPHQNLIEEEINIRTKIY